MGKIKTLIYLLKNDKQRIRGAIAENLAYSSLMHVIPDSIYLKLQYRLIFRKKLNLKNPCSFNEKLQWLKLNNREKYYSMMVDKYRVREYIKQKIGEEYLVSLLGVWEHFDDIDFKKLPNQFVLKCNHDSGSVVICKDKKTFDKTKAKEKLESALQHNMFYFGREWPYKGVKPCIIAEKYMTNDGADELSDYKFFCFNGKVKCFKIDFDRFIEHHANYYSPEGELLEFGEKVCSPDFNRKLEMPSKLSEMIEVAEKLSEGQAFLRVDFYEVSNKVIFGELTFFPASGFGPFVPEEWDYKLGDWIDLGK